MPDEYHTNREGGEAVEVGDEMLVSYYSSHEGRTNVYLARVPLKLQ